MWILRNPKLLWSVSFRKDYSLKLTLKTDYHVKTQKLACSELFRNNSLTQNWTLLMHGDLYFTKREQWVSNRNLVALCFLICNEHICYRIGFDCANVDTGWYAYMSLAYADSPFVLFFLDWYACQTPSKSSVLREYCDRNCQVSKHRFGLHRLSVHVRSQNLRWFSLHLRLGAAVSEVRILITSGRAWATSRVELNTRTVDKTHWQLYNTQLGTSVGWISK